MEAAEEATQPTQPVSEAPRQPIQEQKTTVVTEASVADLRPPVTPEQTLPVLAVDKRGEPPPEPKRLWDILKVLPIAFYTPETSVGLGVGGLFLFDMPGAKAERRPSSVSVAGIYTLERQVVAQVVPELRFGDDDFVLRTEVLGTKYPSRYYGIGNNPGTNTYDEFTDRYLRGGIEARVRPFRPGSPFRNVYVGLEYKFNWTHIQDAEPRKPSEPSLFDKVEDRGEKQFFTSGLGPLIAWDSRDGLNWPLRGSYVELSSQFYEPFLMSDLRYRRLGFDARHYQPLWWSHILALRFVHQSVWGEVPFQQLPQLGGANVLRGWYGGQLRDRHAMALEAEYRLPIGERWAVVGFGSAGQVASHPGKYALKRFRYAGGGGLRFALDKNDRTNVRLDFAYGDRFQFYVHFREAF